MKEINLLPEELKPKTYAIKISKNLRKVAIYGLVAFLIFLMMFGGTILALSFRKSSLDKTEVKLKSQVKSYEETEQRLVLVQDRLGKISNILSANNTSSSLDALELISNNLPSDVVITDVNLTADYVDISFGTNVSQNISKVYGVLEGMNFTQVSLLSLNYNSALGYEAEIEVVK